MRLFFAIELNEDIKNALSFLQREIRKESSEGRFPEPGLFHLTLCFLGEVEKGRLLELDLLMKAVVEGKKVFPLTLQNMGVFPKGRKAIVWAGVKEEEGLKSLQKALVQALEEKGFIKDEAIFRPHITLAREIPFEQWGPSARSLSSFLEHQTMEVRGLSLMESHRVHGRLRYDQLMYQTFKP